MISCTTSNESATLVDISLVDLRSCSYELMAAALNQTRKQIVDPEKELLVRKHLAFWLTIPMLLLPYAESFTALKQKQNTTFRQKAKDINPQTALLPVP